MSQSRLSNSERIYYLDSYRRTFRARAVHRSDDGCRVVFDQTAFYPTSGGQPHDIGRVGTANVTDVIDEDDRVVHVLSEPVPDGELDCEIDWTRRFDHMQQHTGQHLLSAVLAELFEIGTVSFHMGSESSTIDLACPSITSEQLRAAEARVNDLVRENRHVTISFEDATAAAGLRKASERSGSLRIVSIDGLDRSACGGTHVRVTGEIGAILLRSIEKVRGNVRLNFLCGGRAIRRARADYEALELAARTFSAPLDEVPALVLAQTERLKDADKVRRRLETELAEQKGRSLHAATAVTGSGIRLHTRTVPAVPNVDELRAEALGFVLQGGGVFVAVIENPASVMVAASADSGVHAGNVLRSVLSEFGGKGGGSAQMAQGAFAGEPETLVTRLKELLPSV